MPNNKQQWAAAIVPFSWSEATPVMAWQRTVFMSDAVDEADRRRCLESLLDIKWLPPEIRRAVMKQLGLSPRAKKAAEARGWKLAMDHLIDETEARLHKKTGKRSRGAVVQAIADITGTSSETLRKRLQRLSK